VYLSHAPRPPVRPLLAALCPARGVRRKEEGGAGALIKDCL